MPITPQIGRLTFDDAAADLLNDYTTNGKRSHGVVKRRVEKHLAPYFNGRRMANITTPDVRAYVAHRQKQGVVLVDVLKHLPAEIKPVIRFAAITGWRINSEVLPLEWRNVDFAAGEVRLDAGTTKNGEARTFPFTADLRTLLKAQHAEHKRLRKAGMLEPWIFYRMVAEGRRGKKKPQPIVAFTVAWKKACIAAGCPGRIPHDLRRTAIRTMVRRGVPERVAMMLSGHRTRSVFERYNIVSHTDLNDAARKLDDIAVTQNRAAR